MITFTVYGKPGTQGSKKYVGHRKGKPILADMNKNLKSWREEVGWQAHRAICANRKFPYEPHLMMEVNLDFHFKRTKSSKLPYPPKGDLDKLVRAIGDACTGIIWHDDSQIVKLSATKRYGPVEGVHITVSIIKTKDY